MIARAARSMVATQPPGLHPRPAIPLLLRDGCYGNLTRHWGISTDYRFLRRVVGWLRSIHLEARRCEFGTPRLAISFGHSRDWTRFSKAGRAIVQAGPDRCRH